MNFAEAQLALFPTITAAATKCGYGLGVHQLYGKATELIAAPWVDAAVEGEALIRALAESIGLPDSEVWGPFECPFGRVRYTLCVASDIQFLVSVIPRC